MTCSWDTNLLLSTRLFHYAFYFISHFTLLVKLQYNTSSYFLSNSFKSESESEFGVHRPTYTTEHVASDNLGGKLDKC